MNRLYLVMFVSFFQIIFINTKDELAAPYALHSAVKYDDISRIKSILKKIIPTARVDFINQQDAHGRTPIFYVKSAEALHELMKFSPDLSITDRDDKSILFFIKDEDLLQAILPLLGDSSFWLTTIINQEDRFGNTALFYAQSANIAQIFIDNGADVNHRDKSGITPLVWFLQKYKNDPSLENAQIIELLLEKEADFLSAQDLAMISLNDLKKIPGNHEKLINTIIEKIKQFEQLEEVD